MRPQSTTHGGVRAVKGSSSPIDLEILGLLNIPQRKRLNPSDPLANPVFLMRSLKNQGGAPGPGNLLPSEKIHLNGLAKAIAKKEAKRQLKLAQEMQQIAALEHQAEAKEARKERKRLKRELQRQAMK